MPRLRDDPTKATAFGRFIQKRREELGLSQAQVAKACGKQAPESIGTAESGKRGVDLAVLPALAHALDVNLIELFKLYMEEPRFGYPALARALFKDPSIFRKKREHISEDEELVFKLSNLDRSIRVTVIDMINKLYAQQDMARKVS